MRTASPFRPVVVCLFSFLFSFGGASTRDARAQAFELVGTRAQGMAGAFVAVADDATATWWNPAGLAGGPFFNALIEYDEASRPSENRAGGFALAVPSLGLSYYRIPVRYIRPVSTTDQVAAIRQDQGVLNQFGATVGQSIGRYLVVASTLKLTRAVDDTHAGLDVGAMVSYHSLRVGITARNMTNPSFGTGADLLDPGRQVRAGLAFTGRGRSGIDQVTVAFDSDLTRVPTPTGDERHIAGGAEIWTMKRRLGLRGGASANTVGATRASASGGLSVAVHSKIYLDGVYTGGSDPIRNGWGVDFRVTF
jgi:hypothetical protein